MKKKMLMLLMITSIFSCTEIGSRSVSYSPESSHSNNSSTKDLIIGNWRLKSSHSKLPIESNLDIATDCEKKSILNFNEDGSVTGTVYTGDFPLNKDCHGETVNSTWKNNDDATYSIDGVDIDIIFGENNNSFTIRCRNTDDACIFKILHSINTFKKS